MDAAASAMWMHFFPQIYKRLKEKGGKGKTPGKPWKIQIGCKWKCHVRSFCH